MKILVIEDEPGMLDLIRMTLELENFDVITAMEGNEGIELFKKIKPDLVILDLMLPDTDGFKVLKKLQDIDYKIPIIVLTAKSSQNDKLLGLSLGADDYITKPFDSKELVLRIRVILKRIKKAKDTDVSKNVIEYKGLKLFKDARRVLIDGKEIHLTKKEFDLLKFLMEHYSQVFSREVLLEKIWGFEIFVNTRAVDMTIQRLRKKLKDYGKYIKSLYGIGYKFEVED